MHLLCINCTLVVVTDCLTTSTHSYIIHLSGIWKEVSAEKLYSQFHKLTQIEEKNQQGQEDWNLILFFFSNRLNFFIFSTKPNGASQMCSGKESTCQCERCKKHEFNPWIRKMPRRRKWEPTPVFLPGKFHGQRSLVGYSPWVGKKSDVTEHAHTKPNGIWYTNFSKVQVQFFQKVQV